jgi:hypothetical protein
MAERRMGQLDWADALVGDRLGGNARLERIAALVDWPWLVAPLAVLHDRATGRPAYPAW